MARVARLLLRHAGERGGEQRVPLVKRGDTPQRVLVDSAHRERDHAAGLKRRVARRIRVALLLAGLALAAYILLLADGWKAFGPWPESLRHFRRTYREGWNLVPEA